eukprot:PhM_4_TR11668/c1_g2_i5/m.63985
MRYFFARGNPAGSVVVLTDSSAAAGAFEKGRSGSYAVNRSVGDFQKAGVNASYQFRHIAGELNPADSLSRGKGLGDTEPAIAQRVHDLVIGLPLSGGSSYHCVFDAKSGDGR